jgi:MFS family permease
LVAGAYFSVGIALFTLASVACAAAGRAGALVLARLLQGLGAALISPQVLSIIGIKYTGVDRVRALSIHGTVMGLGAVGGQIIGGALLQADIAGLGWRSTFVINVPVGLAVLALAPRFLTESRADNPARVDLLGALLTTTGLVALVLPLTEGRQDGWPAWSWLSLASAPVLIGIFAVTSGVSPIAARRCFHRSYSASERSRPDS